MPRIEKETDLQPAMKHAANHLFNAFCQKYWQVVDAGKEWQDGVPIRQEDAQRIIIAGENVQMADDFLNSSEWRKYTESLAAEGVVIKVEADVVIPLNTTTALTDDTTIMQALTAPARFINGVGGKLGFQSANIAFCLTAEKHPLYALKQPRSSAKKVA